MLNLKIVNATEARNNFYRLLKAVANGEQIIIEHTETGKKFELKKIDHAPQPDKVELIKKMGQIGLKSLPIQEIKQILHTKSNIKLQ